MTRLLFIDDDENAQSTLRMVLPEEYRLYSSLTGREGLEAVRSVEPDVVLLDISLPDLDGLEVLEALSGRLLAPPVIMLTAYSDVELVKRAIRLGAYDYLLKPYRLDQLVGTLRRAVQNIPVRRFFQPAAGEEALAGLVGESPALREVRALLARYGPSDAPVLIEGESGTGKELAAAALHRLSPRREGPLVPVNCGAIPETLLESELFGVERGAYTDAVARPGCFEQAAGGSIFLDEIGEMSLSAQVRLLRVLESKEIVRVGGRQHLPLNIRVLAATNRGLREAAAGGRFREDLFYRIGVLPVRLPPLRERKEDLPLLALHLLRGLGGETKSIEPAALERLARHDWPGNVRELRNALERAALLADGAVIRVRDIVL